MANWRKVITDDPNVQRLLALRTELIGMVGTKSFIINQYQLEDQKWVISDLEIAMVNHFAADVDSEKITVTNLKY